MAGHGVRRKSPLDKIGTFPPPEEKKKKKKKKKGFRVAATLRILRTCSKVHRVRTDKSRDNEWEVCPNP
jgi:hypothetical protein